MKKYIMMMAAGLAALPILAQETYENAKLVENDLNGTARYVGMGGAMEALGADISTISTNPAGIGLFRKSMANVSLGFVSQQDAPDFGVGKKTYMSFDQIGFVVAMQSGPTSYVNFGFNYHKSKNFDYILGAADRLKDASQQKVTYEKSKEGLLYEVDKNGNTLWDNYYNSCSQLDDMYAMNLTSFYDGSSYSLDRSHTGYIGEYDFNVSGNANNRIFWGFTLGLHSVHYKHYGEYTENLVGYPDGSLTVTDERKIKGTGADLKAGIIFMPVDESPFRVGLSVASPTWYNLTSSNYTAIGKDYRTDDYDFNLNMPWKFGVSLGHIIGGNLALGLSYEYSDYSSIDTRIKKGNRNIHDSESDEVMNRHTQASLRAVNTLKVGVEFKPVPEMAIRLGYNWVSPMYKKDAFKDGTLDSYGSLISSATDFTNWKQTNRITCGIGYQFDRNLNLAAAYQYSGRNGDFEPFASYVDNDHANHPEESNICDVKSVSFKRHQLLVTATYTF